MAQRRPIPAQSSVPTFLAVGLVILVLFAAREFLIPIALSVLLTFVLTPIVSRLERLHLGRVPAVLLAVTVAFGAIFGLGYVVGKQVYGLATQLPTYGENIVKKAQALQGTGGGLGSQLEDLGKKIEEATEKAPEPTTGSTPAGTPSTTQASGPPQPAAGDTRSIGEQLSKDPKGELARTAVGGAPSTATTQAGLTPANPLFTVALDKPASPLQTMATYLGLVAGPLGTAGLVIVFTIFMLLEREQLRDRMIRLISRGKYTLTTQAIGDATARISRYLVAQSIVNGTYGITIAFGLWLIGATLGGGTPFPSFVLWGLLCAVLRFIPYIGPWLAAAFPVALSLAVYEGFGVFGATLALFVVIELLSNNVMEPWLYGTTTGLSTLAILVAAVFWTWLWGPIGLLLSTPLTVIIVVLGKYVTQLHFLDILLSDEDALPPAVSYYQRLLAGDKTEAAGLVKEVVSAKGCEHLADDILVPALVLARRDRRDEDLTPEREAAILDASAEIVHQMIPRERTFSRHHSADTSDLPWDPAAESLPLIVACPAHHRSEETVLQTLWCSETDPPFRLEILSTRLLPTEIEARVERERPTIVLLAVLPPGGLMQARYLCRRLRKRFPEIKIIVAYLGRVRDFDGLLVRLRSAGATYVTTSMSQSLSQVQAVLARMGDTADVKRSPAPADGAAAGKFVSA